MPDNTSQIIASILLGSLPAFIPNNTLRYSALAIIACLTVIYTIYLKHPSTQLRQLQEAIATTKEMVGSAKLQCPRDHLSLMVEWARLLVVEQSASMIQCHIWGTGNFTWTKYRLLSNNIGECFTQIKSIRNAVQHVMEAEHQRKLAEDINETESILASVRYITARLMICLVDMLSNLFGILNQIFKKKYIRKIPNSSIWPNQAFVKVEHEVT
ncbi:hypothetical protein C8R44DRAFT_730640 [Mycena epipterygia]|nr:hypothetical protein C8R44DRAFT_730640 [Mycena epipterygia]